MNPVVHFELPYLQYPSIVSAVPDIALPKGAESKEAAR